MTRVRATTLLLLTALLGGCSPAPPAQGPGVVEVPEVAGVWEAVPAAPLTPRGGTRAVWAGTEVVLWGGRAVDPDVEPCPPAASCGEPPPGPEAAETAAYDPAARTWRRLPGTPPDYGHALWTGRELVDQSSRYDPATGTTAFHPANDLLVYARAQLVGGDLVVVGWDYDAGEQNGAGQVAAATLDLDDPAAAWRQVEWPLPPPGAEGLATATDGTDVLVASSVGNPAICPDAGGYCSRLLRFSPAAGTWTDLGTPPGGVPQLVSGDGRVLGLVDGPSATDAVTSKEVVAVDPADGSTTSLGETGSSGDLLVSPAGRLALAGGPDLRVRGDDGRWRRLPAAPGDPVDPAVVWAGEELLVWGGAAVEGEPGSRNSADGWVFRPAS